MISKLGIGLEEVVIFGVIVWVFNMSVDVS
jgi:hypothetical protein